MGFILGIAVSVWVMALALLIKEGTFTPSSEKQAQVLFWILIAVILITGGVAGWVLQFLL